MIASFLGIKHHSLVAQMVKNLCIVRETQVQSLSLEDPLEKEMQPTPIFLPRTFHGHRSLAGYSPWGSKDPDTTEQLTHTDTHTHMWAHTHTHTHTHTPLINICHDFSWCPLRFLLNSYFPSTDMVFSFDYMMCPQSKDYNQNYTDLSLIHPWKILKDLVGKELQDPPPAFT